MNANDDGLICGSCKGQKVLINESTGKAEICPMCKGKGKIETTSDISESSGDSSKKLLKG